MTSAPAARGRVRPDLVYLGWRPAVGPADPDPVPEPPQPVEPTIVTSDWLASRQRQASLLTRPARLRVAYGALGAGAGLGCWLGGVLAFGPSLIAMVGGTLLGAVGAGEVLSGERRLRSQVRAEAARVHRARAVQLAELEARQVEHARNLRAWQERNRAHRRQPQWRPITMAAQIGRLDVVGGTAAGWSALVTMIAATRLAAAGDVTVLDLTDGGQAAAGILAHAPDWRIIPLTWTLPGDLPSLNLGVDLGSDALADVLALTAAAARPGESDQAADAALLGGVLQALGPAASMAQLMAALRVLAQTGDPRRQLSGSDLSAAQLKELAVMAGRGTEQLVANRAWLLEARLRVLGRLGRPPASPLPARLRVAWTDRTAAPTESRVLGCYLTAACAAALQQLPPAEPWQQTVCLLGADRLSADVLDRITAAAETAGAGLVLGFQSIPPVVRARLGRGNAAVAVMRLGNAQDARVAAEQIGTEHRFVVSQLTDTVGTSSTDTSSDTYTGTWGVTTSVADSVSVSSTIGSSSAQGRSRHGRFSPFPEVSESANRDTSMSAAASETLSLSAATTASHSFGSTGARAAGASRSLAGTVNRSRELLVEQHELQYLPETTLLLCKPGAEGREVVLADANPTILRLSSATMVCPVAEPAAGP